MSAGIYLALHVVARYDGPEAAESTRAGIQYEAPEPQGRDASSAPAQRSEVSAIRTSPSSGLSPFARGRAA